MQDPSRVDEGFLQVRRAIAAIAYENGDIDEQERLILASSVAGQFQLSESQLRTLLDDAVSRPQVEDLVSSISDSRFLRLLLVDLMTLALAKEEWEESELSAAVRAIDALSVSQGLVEKVRRAFESLVDVSKDIKLQI